MGACTCGYSTDPEKNCNGTHKVVKAVKEDLAIKLEANGFPHAAELHIDFAADLKQDLAYRRFILGFSGKCTVQIHQVKSPRSLVHPAAGHGRRVFAKGGGLVHVALFETHTQAVLQVNRRDE